MVRSFLLYLVLTFAVFGRSLRYDFVYDDHSRIVNNRAIASLKNLPAFFSDVETQSDVSGINAMVYRPFTTTAFALTRALWGLNPMGFRLNNFVIHAANAALTAALAVELGSLATVPALGAGGLFLLHPAQVETTVWPVEFSNVLSTFFLLAALLCWIRLQKTNERRWTALSLAALASALLTKETAVLVPVLLFLFDGWLRRARPAEAKARWSWRRYGAVAAVAALYAAIHLRVCPRVKAAPYWGGTFGTNLANVFYGWTLYVGKTLWPFPLRISYVGLRPVDSWAAIPVLAGVAAAALVAGLCVWGARRGRVSAPCLLAYGLCWLPVSNLIPHYVLYGDRYLYVLLPFAAVAFADTAALALRHRDRWRAPAGAAAVGLLAAMAVADAGAVRFWRNDFSLWERATQVAPQDWYGWACLARAHFKAVLQGSEQDPDRDLHLRQTEACLLRALRCGGPSDQMGYLFLLLAHVDGLEGKTDDQKMHLERAQQLVPGLHLEIPDAAYQPANTR